MTKSKNMGPSPSLASIAKSAQRDRKTYFDDPSKDQLLDIILDLAEQHCVLKDRLVTAEKIVSGKPDDIDAYEITPEEMNERLEAHSAFMNALFARIADLK